MSSVIFAPSPLPIDALSSVHGFLSPRLTEMGRKALSERNKATPASPVTAPGFNFWSTMVREMRTALMEQGFNIRFLDGFDVSESPSGELLICCMSCDDATGDLNRMPQSKNPKGVVMNSATRQNMQLLLTNSNAGRLLDMTAPGNPMVLEGKPLAALLLHLNPHKRELQAELAIPIKVANKRKITQWDGRMPFETMNLSQYVAPPTERFDDEGEISFEVGVRGKQ